jgi:Methyltransferase domain
MSTVDRRELLLSLIKQDGLGLEIGPGFNPLLPKAEGYRVETLDHASREQLVAKYAQTAGVDTSRIEPVDHVSTGASVFDAVGKLAHFDYIVASHVIEHTTDMLGFLKDCQRLLKPDGVLALAVPDKRYSFDVLRPLSSTGDVLQAHLDKRTRHPAGRVFDEVAYNALRAGALAWGPDAHGELQFFMPLANAAAIFDDAQHSSHFHDIHAWQFTPSSFRLIVGDLHSMGQLGLRELAFYGDRGGEFVTSLALHGAGPELSRIALARQAIEEMKAVYTA